VTGNAWRPDDRRFLFVTGKGGVGKTTVCAAMASALAARDKRVLIAMCQAKERISTMFGSSAVGADIVPVGKNVWAVNIQPEHALEEYGSMILKIRALYSTVFQNRYVRSFFRAVPGLYDWSMLGKAWYHTTEVDREGRPRFDVVLLDAPATGHGLDMLRVPKVILEVVPPGILRRDAEKAWETFRDARRTSIVVVTIPEELPTSETLDLTRAIRNELGLDVGALVINRTLERLFSAEEQAALERATSSPDAREPGDQALVAGARRAVRERVQIENLARLDGVKTLERIVLPELYEEVASPTAVHRLAARF
jgi:anion-transporting  ArsA/GET3 family ATPase